MIKNITIQNKIDKFFKSLKIHNNLDKVNIVHINNLPRNIEGLQKNNNIFISKNFKVSDKKAESILMHEIYHFTNIVKYNKNEEKIANKIENEYLNNFKKYEINEQEIYDRLYLKVRKLLIGKN